MLFEESKWIGNEIIKICKPGSSVLNIGSSNLKHRVTIQPHMEKHIFKPLSEKEINVIHTDIQNDEGVDIVGDLTNQDFISILKKKKYDLILCSNVLEHLTDKKLVIDAISQILPKNGFAIITVPFNYPYHLDPIDNMYRPNVNELKSEFPNMKFIKGKIINGRSFKNGLFQKNYWEQLITQPKLLFILSIRIFVPFYKFNIWKKIALSLLKIFDPFSVTCILIKK